MVCPKCGAKMCSDKKVTGQRHRPGGPPEIPVHRENLSTLCPGTVKRPVLAEFYYKSVSEYDKRKSKMVKRRAAEAAREERLRWKSHQDGLDK